MIIKKMMNMDIKYGIENMNDVDDDQHQMI